MATKTTDDDVERVVSLLPFELSMPIMQQQFSTASLTWYELEKGQTFTQVASSLRERLIEILEANPWLGGRIKTRNRSAAIVYTPAESKKQVDTIFSIYMDIPVSMDMPYPEVSALLQRTTVPLTYWFVWNWNVPFFRVALVQDCSNKDRFALISSLAHCVGDGKTYYNLHNMISCKAPVVSLRIERKHHLHEAMTKTMGGPAFMGCYSEPSLGFVFRIIRSVLLSFIMGPPTVVKLFVISDTWIKEQKKEGLLIKNEENDASLPKFLSSNDVMASKFLRITGCDEALMTVNFRGKIPGCNELDAGNYYNFNPLRWADFRTPVGIRKVVNQLKSGQRYPTTRPMTSTQHLFSHLSTPISFFTNWSDFNVPVPLAKCEQLLHMPLVPTHSWRMPPRLFSICYVFKPNKECDKLAVLVSATPKAMADLEESGMMGSGL